MTPTPFCCDINSGSVEERNEFKRLYNIFVGYKLKYGAIYYGLIDSMNWACEIIEQTAAIQGFARIIPLTEGISILKEMVGEEEKQTDGWISVKDRLPSKDGNSSISCLCWDSYHHQIRVLCYNEHHGCWDDESGDDYYTDAIGGKVTHWMPLPNPPKP